MEANMYNRFYSRIKPTLKKIVQYSCDSTPFDQECLNTLHYLEEGEIPHHWKHQGIASSLGLFEYADFMREGAQYFQKWNREGLPEVFTLSYFFVPQRILHAISQNYAI